MRAVLVAVLLGQNRIGLCRRRCPRQGLGEANAVQSRLGNRRRGMTSLLEFETRGKRSICRRMRLWSRSRGRAHEAQSSSSPRHRRRWSRQEAWGACLPVRGEVRSRSGLQHPNEVRKVRLPQQVRRAGNNEKDLSKPRSFGHRPAVNPRCHLPDMYVL